jgi:hypothetical protein
MRGKCTVTKISRRVALLGTAVFVSLALYGALGADAAGTFAAHAQRPSYDPGALELTGRGGYTTARAHTELKVTVCLQKRLGGRSFSVRCATGTGTGSGRRVSAEVAVPGCVKGSWRTAATGAALNEKGAWVHRASATSAPFSC